MAFVQIPGQCYFSRAIIGFAVSHRFRTNILRTKTCNAYIRIFMLMPVILQKEMVKNFEALLLSRVQSDSRTLEKLCLLAKSLLRLTPSLSYINAGNTPGGKYSYFDVIMVLYIISYKIITIVGIYTKFFSFFPACLKHLVQCLK